VAQAFATLVDEGVLDFDDRLDKLLPVFAGARVQEEGSQRPVKARSPILLKHLLGHQSGIGYPVDITSTPEGAVEESMSALQRGVARGSIRSLRAFVERLAKIPLLCHPGEGYQYGYSMDVMGRVLEVVCGKPLDKVLTERVFLPLGMSDTMWEVPADQLHRLAALYGKAATWGALYGDDGKTPISCGHGLVRLDGDRAEESGWAARAASPVLSGGGFITYTSGGLVTTVADTVRFVQMLLRKGLAADGRRYLQERTLATMERNRAKKSWGQGMSCYLGNVGVFREGGTEFGMGGAACTYWSVDRAEDVATVWFTQHVDMPNFDEDIRGVDPAKADLWLLMHNAVKRGVKRGAGQAAPAAKRRRGYAGA